MATIKKIIQNLKPGKQYLLTVKPKNSDINATLDPSSAVRFVVPTDATVPEELGNLVIVGNYKSIMISFNPSNEADLLGYNYEVYLAESIQQSGSSYSVISGQTPFLSGFSSSNVISLDVPENTESTNSIDSITGVTTSTTTEKIYFARVQSIDTSNNKSSFTPITASTATTLIDSAHIINLTASKITAGTIGAHTITMAGGTSVIKSSTFDGVDVGGGSYSSATTGWLINGSGRAYFYDATIAGSIDIGGFDSGSFHVDSEGNLWLGSGTLVNAPFKVLKEGDVTANTITTKNLTLTGNTVIASNSKIFLGVGTYNNTNTPFYVDDTSQFSLGDKLTWDGTTLTVRGNIKLADGSDAINGEDAQGIADEAVGDLEENIYTDGFIGGLTINSTQMYYGAGSFNSPDTAFYVAKNNAGQADFSLGNRLVWNGNTLTINGTVSATDGYIGGWQILANGKLRSSNLDNPMIFDADGHAGTGAILAGGILIGGGEVVAQNVEIRDPIDPNSDESRGIYYWRPWAVDENKSGPPWAISFYFDASDKSQSIEGTLYAYIYGEVGTPPIKYCIETCGAHQDPTTTSDPSTTQPPATTSDPSTTQPPATTSDPSTTQPPAPDVYAYSSFCSNGQCTLVGGAAFANCTDLTNNVHANFPDVSHYSCQMGSYPPCPSCSPATTTTTAPTQPPATTTTTAPTQPPATTTTTAPTQPPATTTTTAPGGCEPPCPDGFFCFEGLCIG